MRTAGHFGQFPYSSCPQYSKLSKTKKSHKLILDLDVINSSCQSLFFSLPALGPKIVWSASQTGQKDSHAHSLPQAHAENLIANNSFILINHFYILNTNINFVMCILLRGDCNIYV